MHAIFLRTVAELEPHLSQAFFFNRLASSTIWTNGFNNMCRHVSSGHLRHKCRRPNVLCCTPLVHLWHIHIAMMKPAVSPVERSWDLSGPTVAGHTLSQSSYWNWNVMCFCLKVGLCPNETSHKVQPKKTMVGRVTQKISIKVQCYPRNVCVKVIDM